MLQILPASEFVEHRQPQIGFQKNRASFNMIVMKHLLVLLLLSVGLCEGHVVFLHVPKTGGTTLHYLLKQNFPTSSIYPFLKIDDYLHVVTTSEGMEEAFQMYPSINHEVIGGHFPIWFLKQKAPHYDDSFIFTVLRDPIERVLSEDRDNIREKLIRNLPAESDLSVIPANYICKMFCSDCRLGGNELLQDCIQNLRRMNYVIFMDDYKNGVREVFRKLGLGLPQEIPHHNSTNIKAVHAVQSVSKETIQKIKQLNSLDIQLYEYANTHFRGKSLPKNPDLRQQQRSRIPYIVLP